MVKPVRTQRERFTDSDTGGAGAYDTRMHGRNAIYEGTVTHQRAGHDGHRFDQRVRMVLFDLDRVDALCQLHPLWSARHPAPVWFRRRDFLGERSVSLTTAVYDVVEQRSGVRPTGPVTLLTNPRTWGWLFNPISFYFCYDLTGTRVEHMVVEVTNTPWLERHAYVVGPPGVYNLTKSLHVSPFLDVDQQYQLEYSLPGNDFDVRFTVSNAEGPQLFAGVTLERHAPTRRSLGHIVWNAGRGTIGVSLGIYRQAFTLWRKGTTFHDHPRRAGTRAKRRQSKSPDA
jgi:DUF1365 family protein